MAEIPSSPTVKGAIYNIPQLLNCCQSGNPKDVTSLTLSFDYEIWELICGWTAPPVEMVRFFEDKQCPIELRSAGGWEKKHEQLVAARLAARDTAWRWPSKPLEWNTQPFPPDEEIEEMYRTRVEEVLSTMKTRAVANPPTPSFIRLLWSCLNAFTSVKELELDLNAGLVYNWKMGRGEGAGYRAPNFTPEIILIQDMVAAVFPGLTSLSTAASKQRCFGLWDCLVRVTCRYPETGKWRVSQPSQAAGYLISSKTRKRFPARPPPSGHGDLPLRSAHPLPAAVLSPSPPSTPVAEEREDGGTAAGL